MASRRCLNRRHHCANTRIRVKRHVVVALFERCLARVIVVVVVAESLTRARWLRRGGVFGLSLADGGVRRESVTSPDAPAGVSRCAAQFQCH